MKPIILLTVAIGSGAVAWYINLLLGILIAISLILFIEKYPDVIKSKTAISNNKLLFIKTALIIMLYSLMLLFVVFSSGIAVGTLLGPDAIYEMLFAMFISFTFMLLLLAKIYPKLFKKYEEYRVSSDVEEKI